MPYLAVDRLKVGHDDATGVATYREPGEPIPEAEGWPWTLRDAYLRNHRITEVASLPHPAKKEGAHAK